MRTELHSFTNYEASISITVDKVKDDLYMMIYKEIFKGVEVKSTFKYETYEDVMKYYDIVRWLINKGAKFNVVELLGVVK